MTAILENYRPLILNFESAGRLICNIGNLNVHSVDGVTLHLSLFEGAGRSCWRGGVSPRPPCQGPFAKQLAAGARSLRRSSIRPALWSDGKPDLCERQLSAVRLGRATIALHCQENPPPSQFPPSPEPFVIPFESRYLPHAAESER